MDNNLLQYIFSQPLKEYLTFANYNLSDFYEQIWTQNDLILNVLSVLGKFKAYDILLPFNILIKLCFDEKQMEWWNGLISMLDNSEEIDNLSKKLYIKIKNSKKTVNNKKISEFERLKYAFSVAQIESFVWEVCLEYNIDICQCDNNSVVCLYVPGLYMSESKYAFWKDLDEKVFSQLLKKCQDISVSIMPDRFETALIKRTIYIFSSELGTYYYNLMGNLAVQIISFSKTDLEKINDKLLIQIIKRMTGDDFYISERWVMQLEELHKYTDRYQLNSFSCKALEFCLSLYFYVLYELVIDDILQGIKSGIEEIEDAYWILKNLFNNRKIISVIDKLLLNIGNEKINYTTRIIYVSRLYKLFFSLASHLETEVRVCIREVSAFVEIPKSDDYKRLFEKREIFGIYNPIQVKELRELGKRMKNVYENVPRYYSTFIYENNMVNDIRERIIESQKQIIGSDIRKTLIIK